MRTLILLIILALHSQAFAQWSNIEMARGRGQHYAAGLDSNIYIVGGLDDTWGYSTIIDAYNTYNGSWSELDLWEARAKPSVVAAQGKLIIAGGVIFDPRQHVSSVEIIDLATLGREFAELSIARTEISGVTVGDKVLFAGGLVFDATPHAVSEVDIYDLRTHDWRIDTLSEARGGMAHAVVGTKAIFAGGYKPPGEVSNAVDIYDSVTDEWTKDTIPLGRAFYHGGVGTDTKAYFAGGLLPGNEVTNRIDIYDLDTKEWSTDTLSHARYGIQASRLGNKLYFAAGGTAGDLIGWLYQEFSNVVDIYDFEEETWSTPHTLEKKRINHAGLSLGNQFFIVGGITEQNPLIVSAMDVFTDETISSLSGAPIIQAYSFLSPNPVGDQVQVNIPEEMEETGLITIYSSTGLQLFQAPASDPSVLVNGVCRLAPGFYLLKGEGKGYLAVQKFVKH